MNAGDLVKRCLILCQSVSTFFYSFKDLPSYPCIGYIMVVPTKDCNILMSEINQHLSLSVLQLLIFTFEAKLLFLVSDEKTDNHEEEDYQKCEDNCYHRGHGYWV